MVSSTSDVERDRIATPGAPFGRQRQLRIAIVGSSKLEAIPWALWEYLIDGTPKGTTVLLRRGMKSAPGQFEQFVRELIREQGDHLNFEWRMPDPDAGAGATFLRDNDMVSSADLVLAFFDPHHVMAGGTGHVVETAIDRNVPVYSFAIDGTSLTRVGDHDPEALWQQTVEGFFTE